MHNGDDLGISRRKLLKNIGIAGTAVAVGTMLSQTGGSTAESKGKKKTTESDSTGACGCVALTTDMISDSYPGVSAGGMLETGGFYTAGIGGAKWMKTADTSAPSQTPGQRGSATLTDADGVIWQYVPNTIGEVYFDDLGAKADYDAVAKTGTDNSPVLKACIAYAGAGIIRISRGLYGFSTAQSIVFNNPVIVKGTGRRFGSRFYFFGTGPKWVKTQRKHPDDGTDDPISTAFSVESANVHLEDLYIANAFSGTDPAGDYGSDWDVGIFIRSKSFFTATRVRVEGYWRLAGTMYDVTQERGNCDGSTLHDYWSSGFWGLLVYGPLPKTGTDSIVSGDLRGAGGFSDFYIYGSSRFFDMNHHRGSRMSDTDGGAFKIDGNINTPAKSIQGHHFHGTRFASSSPYSIRVGASSRDYFVQCHIERFTGRYKADGVTPANDTHIEISADARHTKFDKTVWYNQGTNVFVGNDLEFRMCVEGFSSGQKPYYHTQTFAPRLSTSTGGVLPDGQHAIRQGYWRKGEGIITFSIRLQLNDITGASGNVSIIGLPAAIMNKTNGHEFVSVMTLNVSHGTGTGSIQGLIGPNSDKIDLYLNRSGAGSSRLTAAELLSSSFFHVTGTLMIEPSV
ncbi:twin-arginine translocation signal domain-containing protein [Paenibacillus oceani]|uniref:Twin-arginine translocation signal domain-containing protein n=1 Tax=Paenibacillus oceani TaxID=2772510 RepID=A0A927CAF3_9BACL|nr:twin-arginine translocation signal domain-containing protein [Paenibacillus oceani]MBD2862671.1 twin-arginine translocation signal domain-containing protein [Paenibacillus oceani]